MPKQCSIRYLLIVALVTTWFSTPLPATQVRKKKSVTVADTIRMTTVALTRYAGEDSARSRVALYSPDGKRFVVLTERGFPETTEREFSLLLFRTDELFHSQKPKILLSLRSRSNRDGIRNVRWLDNDRLVFLTEAHDSSQVYSLRITGKRLQQLTDHPTPIVDFDFNAKAEELAYAAEAQPLGDGAA